MGANLSSEMLIEDQLKKYHATIITSLFVFSIMSPYAVAKTKILRLGYIEFHPYFYTNGQGNPEGIFIDIAEKVFREAGFRLEAVQLPTKRMAAYLGDGEIDVWMGLKTLPEFEGKAYLGNSVLAELVLRAYMIGEKPYLHIKEDLKNKKIIVLRGYSYGGWIHYLKYPSNNIELLKADSHQAAFQMLNAGRADYVLDYRRPSEVVLQQTDITDIRFSDMAAFPCFFVVSKKLPQGQIILDLLEHAFQKLKLQGLLPD